MHSTHSASRVFFLTSLLSPHNVYVYVDDVNDDDDDDDDMLFLTSLMSPHIRVL